jgi:hypothetical protein
MAEPTGYKFWYNGFEKDFADVFDATTPGTIITGHESEAYGGLDLGLIFTPTTGGTIQTFYENSTNTDLGSIFTQLPPLTAAGLVVGNVDANMNTTGMTLISFINSNHEPSNNNDGYAYLPFSGMDFYFFGRNYGNTDGAYATIFMTTHHVFAFKHRLGGTTSWGVNFPAILFDFYGTSNIESYISPPQNGTISGVKYVRIVAIGTDYLSFQAGDITTVKKAYEVFYVRDNNFQYMQFNCNKTINDRTKYNNYSDASGNFSNITNGTAYQNTFGPFGNTPSNTEGPQPGGSYVIRSNLNGENWEFFKNTHLNL